MTNFSIRKQDLITNPTPRVAVCLCLDVSPSMSGEVEQGAHPDTVGVPIDELNKGIIEFYKSIRSDTRAKYSAEVAVVAFSTTPVVERDFESIINATPPQLTLKAGGTSLGTAIEKCLTLLENRKNEYKEAGVDHYQPWLIVMTDGLPTDQTHQDSALKVVDLVNKKKLSIIPIGIGGGADREALSIMSPKFSPLKLKGLKFKEFFEWLSCSISGVSRTSTEEEYKPDYEKAKRLGDPLN